MFVKNLWRYPLLFGVLGAFIGLVLRYAFTGALQGFPFKNVLHSHSHILLLGFVFNALLILIWTNFTDGLDKLSYKYFIALQVCVAIMLVTFILQGYGFYSILFSTLHLWISYILLIRLWKRLKENETFTKFIKIGIVFHFLSSLGPYVLGPLMVFEMKDSSLYQQAIFFYLHFQYFGIFFVWLLAILFKKASVNLNRKHIVIISVSLLLLFAHSLDYSYDHWMINLTGALGSILLLIGLLSLGKFFQYVEGGYKYIYYLVIFVAFINLIGSIPSIADKVVESRLLLIGWLHLLFLGLYIPFIWVMLKRNINSLIWFMYGFTLTITEIILIFPGMVTKYISIPIMWLLFFAYLSVFLCLAFVHSQLFLELRKRPIKIK